jgi:hypothetical protein
MSVPLLVKAMKLMWVALPKPLMVKLAHEMQPGSNSALRMGDSLPTFLSMMQPKCD